ncbi:MAG TPA: hypothetical protein VK306_15115 [Acidimicrobiales bacterium]|nr:hypothetical protein [Acidimicrobiales bacterium]
MESDEGANANEGRALDVALGEAIRRLRATNPPDAARLHERPTGSDPGPGPGGTDGALADAVTSGPVRAPDAARAVSGRNEDGGSATDADPADDDTGAGSAGASDAAPAVAVPRGDTASPEEVVRAFTDLFGGHGHIRVPAAPLGTDGPQGPPSRAAVRYPRRRDLVRPPARPVRATGPAVHPQDPHEPHDRADSPEAGSVPGADSPWSSADAPDPPSASWPASSATGTTRTGDARSVPDPRPGSEAGDVPAAGLEVHQVARTPGWVSSAMPTDRQRSRWMPDDPEIPPPTGPHRAVDQLASPPAALRRPTGGLPVVRSGECRAAGAPGTGEGPQATDTRDGRSSAVPVVAAAGTDTGRDHGPVGDRARWARPVERWLPDLAAIAAASGALVAPWPWLVAVVAVCVGAAVVVVVRGDPDDPVGYALRRMKTWLHPSSLVWGPVLAARVAIVAVIVPAAVAAAAWVAAEGTGGAAAAVRVGVWTHAFRVGAVLLCLLLIGGLGAARVRRAAEVRRRVQRLSDTVLALVAGACVLLIFVVALVLPRLGGGPFTGADGLAWVPPAGRATVDRLRDAIVATELDAVSSCLSRRQATGWTNGHTPGNPLDEPDVARLDVARNLPDPGETLAAVTAAHNQLAPWVETIEVTWAGTVLVRTDRSALPADHVVSDPAAIVAASTEGRAWLAEGEASFNRPVALRCSAGPVV